MIELVVVYGGDVGDKGVFSLRLLRMLTDFKSRYPDRVHLIVGNREAKMTRVTEEAGDANSIKTRILEGKSVFWNLSSLPKDFAQREMESSGKSCNLSEYVGALSTKEAQVLYLKWMLRETMGCGPVKPRGDIDTFRLFKQEIAEIHSIDEAAVSNERVLDVLLKELEPGGAYHKYLTEGVLMKRIGETLFTHGAITAHNLGFVPELAERVADIDRWIRLVNEWYEAQIIAWASGKTAAPATSPPGSSALMWYLVQNPLSVVTTNWYDDEGKISNISKSVTEYLLGGGVRRVISGHQPFSDCPLVLRPSDKLEIIIGDTGFSDMSHPVNNQGEAYHTLEILTGPERRSSASKSEGGSSDYFQSEVSMKVVRKNLNCQQFDLNDPKWRSLGVIRENGVLRVDENGDWVTSQLDGFRIVDTPFLFVK